MLKKIFIIGSWLFLFSCSSSQTFVSDKKTLDPFTIYSYQTLALPPIYYLSATEIADERRFVKNSSREIEEMFFGRNIGKLDAKNNENIASNSKTFGGEEKLLILTNADKDFKNLREKIDEESLSIVIKEASFINKIFANYDGEALNDKLSQYSKYKK
jgi:hypothetical protein